MGVEERKPMRGVRFRIGFLINQMEFNKSKLVQDRIKRSIASCSKDLKSNFSDSPRMYLMFGF